MRQLNRLLLVFLLVLLPLAAWSGETAFVAQEQIEFAKLLPPPPAVGSAVQQEEMALLVTLQKERTPAMEAFALADAERNNASYPSGHSTFGTVDSIILANMVPERATQIYERAEAYRFNREIGGVHYPSDVAAGRIAGTVIAAFLQQSPVFQEAYAAARAETRQVLGLPQ